MKSKSHRVLHAAILAASTYLVGASAAAQETRYSDMDKDEAGLWYVMDKAEKEISTSGARITDAALNAYITDLTCKVVGPECSKLRVYVLNDPSFNAAMAPNGMMLVNSGLMLRAENEAQLSCVIGHEYGHFQKGHSLKQWRAIKDMGNASLFLPIAGALIGTAMVQDFSRDQEREADVVGFEKVSEEGYDDSQCAEVWTNLVGEHSQSTVKRVRKRIQKNKNGMFSSHPVPKERIATLTELANQTEGGVETGAANYKAKTGPFLAKWLENELLAKDYDRHIYLFNELKTRGRNSAIMDYYLGEAHRLRRGEGDKAKAMEYWQSAASGVGAPAETWRAMAEYNRRNGEKAKALRDYKIYLSKAPGAGDKALIEKYIQRLSTET